MEPQDGMMEPRHVVMEPQDTAMDTRPVRPEMPAAPIVDIVVPVYNEEADLESSVRRLRA
jgi:cellulose synthase/poly-beta-1,6-N-acetylglucosamine synthase-like glycosyltransferase